MARRRARRLRRAPWCSRSLPWMLRHVLDRVIREIEEHVLERGSLPVQLVQPQPALGHALGDLLGLDPETTSVSAPVEATVPPAPATTIISSATCGVRT